MIQTPLSRLAGAFALGAALGTSLDAIHAYGDVEDYSNEVLGRLGWFVPLEFGLAGLAAALMLALLERVVGPGRPPPWTVWEQVREIPLIAGLYVTSVVANGPGAVPFAVALAVLLAVRLTLGAAPGDWAFALAAAAAGPAAEAAIHAFGAFDYTEPDFLGLPVWLPLLWANGGLVIRRLFGPLAVPQPDETAERAYVG
jgi:hypothetical protein